MSIKIYGCKFPSVFAEKNECRFPSVIYRAKVRQTAVSNRIAQNRQKSKKKRPLLFEPRIVDTSAKRPLPFPCSRIMGRRRRGRRQRHTPESRRGLLPKLPIIRSWFADRVGRGRFALENVSPIGNSWKNDGKREKQTIFAVFHATIGNVWSILPCFAIKICALFL